jgi:hypothetical protein
MRDSLLYGSDLEVAFVRSREVVDPDQERGDAEVPSLGRGKLERSESHF